MRLSCHFRHKVKSGEHSQALKELTMPHLSHGGGSMSYGSGEAPDRLSFLSGDCFEPNKEGIPE